MRNNSMQEVTIIDWEVLKRKKADSFWFPPWTKQQKCYHKSLVQQEFTAGGIFPGQTLSLQKGRKRSSLSQFPPSLTFPYLLLQNFLPLEDNGKKTVSLLEIQEVNLSFNKNLYSSSILYHIRYSIMQFPATMHKTPPQNRAALFKICWWLLFLEEGPDEDKKFNRQHCRGIVEVLGKKVSQPLRIQLYWI